MSKEYKPETLQDIINRNEILTEERMLEMKLNFCLNDALEIIKEHGEEYFMEELRKRID